MDNSPDEMLKRVTPALIRKWARTIILFSLLFGLLLTISDGIDRPKPSLLYHWFAWFLLVLIGSSISYGICLTRQKIRLYIARLILFASLGTALLVVLPLAVWLISWANDPKLDQEYFKNYVQPVIEGGLILMLLYVIFILGSGLIGWACWFHSKPWKEKPPEY